MLSPYNYRQNPSTHGSAADAGGFHNRGRVEFGFTDRTIVLALAAIFLILLSTTCLLLLMVKRRRDLDRRRELSAYKLQNEAMGKLLVHYHFLALLMLPLRLILRDLAPVL
ncbi:hypothetical protein Ciccas_010057 [Cichlidogyrus casuarinus]|uniref:Uncharacterized protein n=1 Tax=Cichlidogyrus casuarinus TaxID=1844966 RepID=A0ABD2PWS3_9PLAT